MESFGGSEFGDELGGDVASAEGLADDTEAFRDSFSEAETEEKQDTPDDADAEPQGFSGSESGNELASESAPEDLTDDPDAFGHTFREATAEAEAEPEAEPEPEAEAEPEAEREAEPEAEREAEPEAEREAEAEPEAEAQPEPEAKAEAEPEAEADPEPEPEAEAQPEPEAEPDVAEPAQEVAEPEVDVHTDSATPVDWSALPVERQMELAQAEVADGARDFSDNKEAARYGAEQWNDYADKLPGAERTALEHYTLEPGYGVHDVTYRDINHYLRTGAGGTPEVKQHVEDIDRALAGSPTREDLVVSRGTGIAHFGMDPELMVGETFTEHAYMSTSLGEAADSFRDMPAILHLRVPKGTPALWLASVSDYGETERELLLGRDQRWHAERAIWNKDTKQWHIYGSVL